MTEIEGPSRTADVSESISDLVGQKKEVKGDIPDEKGLSDIELLLKGKKFSRQVEVIHFRFCFVFYFSCFLGFHDEYFYFQFLYIMWILMWYVWKYKMLVSVCRDTFIVI